MKRVLLVLAIVAIGAVAPARAWCEASCIAPAEQSESHCPSHAASADTTSISAAFVDECPVLESARPTPPARLEMNVSAVDGYVPVETPRTCFTPSSARTHRASTVFERDTPLRI